jgi:phosphatidylglycerol---prolipoprotein diacylglyceryl transferase
MMLGLAIGRIGCLLNGCYFGAVCDHGWAIRFPADPPYSSSPAYAAQVERGQMHGFLLSDHAELPPRVLAVTPGSAADRAGLKKDDLLVEVNDYKLSGEPISEPTGAAHKALEEAFNLGQPLRLKIANRPAVTIPAIERLPRRSLPVQPTQPLSTIDALLLCLLLLAYDPFRRRDGELFALMLSIYPVTRFCIEGLRSDEATVFGTGMSISQNVSVLLLILAAALWFYILRRPLKIKTTTCPTTKSGSQSRPNP